MNAKRILKEARPLLWPWCAVALAGALPLVHPFDWTPLIYVIGFFAVPLLATLPLGDEFQHRTLSLMLSQPLGRMAIWGEKLSVTVVAIMSAVLVFSLALRATSFHPGRMGLAFAGAWIVAITASATFWTLFARSTVGGVALNIVVQTILILIVPWANLAEWLRANGYFSPANSIVIPTVAIFCYAGLMLWVSGRSLARFQVTGGMAGDDLLMAGPDVMPGALAGWLRCRPSGVVLNLIRKELRLLRPVWLISLLAAVGWACLTLFGFLYERGFSRNFETAVLAMGVVSTLIIAILAGSLSLGEERTSGAHSWHLTLPSPALLQWRIKLYVALFAGLVGAGLLPALMGGRFLYGPSRIFVAGRWFGLSGSFLDEYPGVGFLLVVLLLCFAAFWCACSAKGTVRAALWLFPVLIALYLASDFGERAGREIIDLYVLRFDPFADFKFTREVIASSYPLTFAGLRYIFFNVSWQEIFAIYAGLILTLQWGPTLLLAVVQSYRLFRVELQDSALSLARNLLPLAMLAFLCSFSLTAYDTFGNHAWHQYSTFLRETFEAIEKIQPSAAKLEPTHPLQLTEEDLAKASPLSARTRRCLRNSHVTIVPIKVLPRHVSQPGESKFTFEIDDSQAWYLATIYLAGGSDCTWSGRGWAGGLRMLYVVCQ